MQRAQGFLLAPASQELRTETAGAVPAMVAVVGLRRGSGATTVARGLARVLGASALVVELAPEDLEHRRADVTVLVAPGDGEPALASIAAGLLSARVGQMLVVANAVRDPRPWSGHATVCLPESRLAAMIAARGHLPPGELGAAVTKLAAVLVFP